MSEFAEKLSELNSWQDNMNAPDSAPDGSYTAVLEDAQLVLSSNDRLMVKRQHIIIGGPVDGMSVWDNIVLDTDFGPRQFKKWVEHVGFAAPDDPQLIEELVDTIAAEKPVCSIKVKTSKSGFTNVTVTGIQTSDVPALAPTPTQVLQRVNTPAVAKTFTTGQTTGAKPDAPAVTRTPGVKRVVAGGAAVAAAEEPSTEALIAFASAQGFEVTGDTDRETVIAALLPDSYQRAMLEPEEIALVEAIGAKLV